MYLKHHYKIMEWPFWNTFKPQGIRKHALRNSLNLLSFFENHDFMMEMTTLI